MSKKSAKKKKQYNLSFTAIIKELTRLETHYYEIDDKYNEYETQITSAGIDWEYISDTYQAILDPLILSCWLLFPADYRKYLSEEANIDQQTLAIDKLVQVAQYGTEYLFFEFIDVKDLNEVIFPNMRQYKSIVTIIEKTFDENRNYDLLLEVVEDVLDEMTTIVNNGGVAQLDDLRLTWISNLFCEFEEILPDVTDLKEEQVYEIMKAIYAIAGERQLDEIIAMIEFKDALFDVETEEEESITPSDE